MNEQTWDGWIQENNNCIYFDTWVTWYLMCTEFWRS